MLSQSDYLQGVADYYSAGCKGDCGSEFEPGVETYNECKRSVVSENLRGVNLWGFCLPEKQIL